MPDETSDLLSRELRRMAGRAGAAASPPPASAIAAMGRRRRLRNRVAAAAAPVAAAVAAVVAFALPGGGPATSVVAGPSKPAVTAHPPASRQRATAGHQPNTAAPEQAVPAVGCRLPWTAAGYKAALRPDPSSVTIVWLRPSSNKVTSCVTTQPSGGRAAAGRLLSVVKAAPRPPVMQSCPLLSAGSTAELGFHYSTGAPWAVVTVSNNVCDVVTLPGGQVRQGRSVVAALLHLDAPAFFSFPGGPEQPQAATSPTLSPGG